MVEKAIGPQLTCVGKLFILAFLLATLGGAAWLVMRKGGDGGTADAGGGTEPGKPSGPKGTTSPPDPGRGPVDVEIGIAYGTEKERWLKWATEEYAKTAAGRRVKVNLHGLGSVEGANAILQKDARIHVWAPASRLYRDRFLSEWGGKYGGNPILKGSEGDPLALSPMVFVMWEERHEAFVKKYGTVTFETIGKALAEKGGWAAIAAKPEWGVFKFSHTHPGNSNSGLMTLVLLAYEFAHKQNGLVMADILDPKFQEWMERIERSLSKPGGELTHSTGTMMKDMVRYGPSYYDVIFVYESVVIDNLRNAEGKWGKLRLVYPELNAWNDNPFYVLDVPWSGDRQKAAAKEFLQFLLTEEIQRQSLAYGFRPGSLTVPVRAPGSPFVEYAPYGVKVDLTNICETPRGDVLQNLIMGWERSVGR